MKLFITGGTGFIGSHLLKKLETKDIITKILVPKNENYSRNNSIKGGLSNIDEWKDSLKEFSPDVCIHMAWEGLPDYGYEKSILNLNYGIQLFNLLAKINCSKIIVTGSCWEYGKDNGKLSEELLPMPKNAFTTAKTMLYYSGKEISEKHNIDFIWTRLFYVYGPGQRKTSLIPHIISIILDKKNPDIKYPENKNDFVYVGDVANALVKLAVNKVPSNIYNVGSGILTPVKDVVKEVGRQLNFSTKLKQDTECEIEFYSDISKLKQDTGWQPKVSLKEGIAQTIAYIKN